MSRPIRVLIVDDSAFARKVLRECLALAPDVEVVGAARDGIDALEKIAVLSPDVITLDLVMPNLDGLGVLGGLTDGGPRVVVCSTSDVDSAMVVEALSLGAITAVQKPTALATERLYEVSRPLIAAVKLAAGARVQGAAREPAPIVAPARSATRLVAIGASTGGPQALHRILRALPANFPVPIALVVHMPVGYTEGFAARLDAQCALSVVEAAEGTSLEVGRVVVARAGLHLAIRKDGRTVGLAAEPRQAPHRPSVDVLFQTAAAAFGPSILGVVLTGMGDDGLAGSRAIVAAGGHVITQSAETCVVYGMPRVVAEAGLSSSVIPLDDLALAIASLV